MPEKTYLDFSLQVPLPKRLEQQRLSPNEIDTILNGAYCVKPVEHVGMEFQGDSPIKRIIEAQLRKIAYGDKRAKIQKNKVQKMRRRIQATDLD